MEDAQRLLNPWVLHFQKLGLELKCPLCLQLFKRPVLLPCNHIFCSLCIPKAVQPESECPACKHSYVDRDVKSAPFMENIVNIYRNLDATFNASIIHPVCSDVKCPSSFKMDGSKNLKKQNDEIAQEGNSSNGQSTTLQTNMPNKVNVCAENLVVKSITPESSQKQDFKNTVTENHMETGVNGIGFIQMEQLSPPFSRDSKNDDSCSGHLLQNSVRCSSKRPAENLESNSQCTSGTKSQHTEVKRKKNTKDGSNDLNLTNENVATAKLFSETKIDKNPCAFCHSSESTLVTGQIVSYARGKQVVGDMGNSSKVTHVHEKCIDWAPQIYFNNDGIIKNLESEVARGNKLKCSSCGKKGAVLGCYTKSCQRTYHVPCAYYVDDCRWDQENFLLLCPKHVSNKFPNEKKSKAGDVDSEKRISTSLNPCTTVNGEKNLVFCGSALSSEEKNLLVNFARSNGGAVCKYWRDNVTHVIAATDSNGACTRTLKVLMAILNGKWIVTLKWVKACMEAGHIVDPEPYEVNLDTHGCIGGPKAGRLRILNNGGKLFENMKFFLIGEFVQAFKSDLLNLVATAGGTVCNTKEQLLSSSINEVTVVVYNADLSAFEDEAATKFQRLAAAEDVAQEYGSRVVGHTWILESVAASRLLPFTSDL